MQDLYKIKILIKFDLKEVNKSLAILANSQNIKVKTNRTWFESRIHEYIRDLKIVSRRIIIADNKIDIINWLNETVKMYECSHDKKLEINSFAKNLVF